MRLIIVGHDSVSDCEKVAKPNLRIIRLAKRPNTKLILSIRITLEL